MVKSRSVSTSVSKMLSLDFTWYRDPKGYRLVPATPIPRRPGQDVLDVRVRSKDIQPARIVCNGGKLQSYRPLEAGYPKPIVAYFLDVKNEKDLLDFIRRFGPLTLDGLRKNGDVVLDMIDEAKEMSLVRRHGKIIKYTLNKLNVEIEGLRLKVSPSSLLDALWLQLIQTQDEFKVCEHCGELFAGKRKDARFCSDHCRMEWNNRRR